MQESRIARTSQVRLPERLTPPLGAAAIALATLLGAGGAAAAEGGIQIGWAGIAWTVAAAALAAALLAVRRIRPALAASAGLLVPLVLTLAGLPWAGLRALSGPPLFALALAGIALALARSGLRSGIYFLPAVFAVLVAVAGRGHVQVPPEGDEPHYLMVADSLLRDADVSLERDYAEERYTSFHDAPLEPHYRVRGKGREIYSLHAVGLSVLILPAWAAASLEGVRVLMALLAALAAREVRAWVRELTGRPELAEAAGWLAALSPPLVYYAGLVFTEVPAALALSIGLRLARRQRLDARVALAIGALAASLPWLNVRYAPLAVVVVAHALWRHRFRSAALGIVAPCALSAVGLLAYHHSLYGFWDPRRVYGRQPEFAFATLADGLPGLFLDQEFGLLVYAPLLLLAAPGLPLLIRRYRALGLAVFAAVLAVVLIAASWHMWRGGFNPPARFLVPIAPLLWVALSLVLDKRGLTAGAALLAGWTLWAGLEGAWQPRLVHRDRDGSAPLFRERSGAREWTGLLPAYVLAEPDRDRQAAVWFAALLAAVPWSARAPSAARVALAGLGLAAAAQAAAALSQRPTPDRDAVRLVGRRALEVPGFSLSSANASWRPEGVGWGPLYEPHRHPAGAELARRLPLRPGTYVLVLEGRGLGGEPPRLLVIPDGPTGVGREAPLGFRDGRLQAPFSVMPAEKGVSLRVLGGGPLLVEKLVLTQPSPAGPV